MFTLDKILRVLKKQAFDLDIVMITNFTELKKRVLLESRNITNPENCVLKKLNDFG